MVVRKEDAQNAADRAAQIEVEAARGMAHEAEQGVEGVLRFGREQAERAASGAESVASGAESIVGEIAGSSREGVEASLASGARITRGLQEMGWEIARFSQDSLRHSMHAASELMRCRSFEDAVEVQSAFVRDSMGRLLDEQSRLLRLSRDTAGDAEQAIARRMGQKENRPGT